MEHLFNPLSVVSFVFIVVGILTYKFPPKTINALYGYRTKASMKNQESWDFAQLYSAKKMITIGLVILILSLNFIFIEFSENQIVFISFAIIIFGVVYLLLKTENAIRSAIK